MKTTDMPMAPIEVEQEAPAGLARRQPTARSRPDLPWGRLAVACAILVAAGGSRIWQAWRVESILQQGRTSPFPLKDLPMTLGGWEADAGAVEALDPEVKRALDPADYIKRTYVDERTGVQLDVLVLYGPSTVAHSPEVCYPGVGFVPVAGPSPRTFETRTGPAVFSSLVFARGEGGAAERQAVFFAMRYDGRWSADMAHKRFKRLPGLYKVQVVRRVGEGERLDLSHDPCESFLDALLPEIEGRLSGRRSASS